MSGLPDTPAVQVAPADGLPLWVSLGVILGGGFVGLLFVASASFYWAGQPGFGDTTRALMLALPPILAVLHFGLSSVLVWRSSAPSSAGAKLAARGVVVAYGGWVLLSLAWMLATVAASTSAP